MADPDVRDITLHKPPPKIFEKRDAKRDAERIERIVHAEVDARDLKRCRCCGRKGDPYALEALGRIHRAHIRDASRGGPMSAANLVSLCWVCHALEHAKQLHIVGTDANERHAPLTFEVHEAAVVEVFGTRVLPRHVRIVV
jgi:5-methylcytosine-specific restriction endonuclease McrA